MPGCRRSSRRARPERSRGAPDHFGATSLGNPVTSEPHHLGAHHLGHPSLREEERRAQRRGLDAAMEEVENRLSAAPQLLMRGRQHRIAPRQSAPRLPDQGVCVGEVAPHALQLCTQALEEPFQASMVHGQLPSLPTASSPSKQPLRDICTEHSREPRQLPACREKAPSCRGQALGLDREGRRGVEGAHGH